MTSIWPWCASIAPCLVTISPAVSAISCHGSALALAGGLIVYVLLYFFGFVILRNNFAILWYILMIFSIRMVSFWSMAVATAVLASGVALVVNPPVTAVSTATVTPKPADTATPPLTKTPTPKPGPTLF